MKINQRYKVIFYNLDLRCLTLGCKIATDTFSLKNDQNYAIPILLYFEIFDLSRGAFPLSAQCRLLFSNPSCQFHLSKRQLFLCFPLGILPVQLDPLSNLRFPRDGKFILLPQIDLHSEYAHTECSAKQLKVHRPTQKYLNPAFPAS